MLASVAVAVLARANDAKIAVMAVAVLPRGTGELAWRAPLTPGLKGAGCARAAEDTGNLRGTCRTFHVRGWSGRLANVL